MKEGWEFKKLKEIGRTQTGTTPSKSEKSFYGGDIPFVRPAELDIDGNGAIKYDSELKLTQEGALKSRIISANSILMCCIGSVGKTGYSIKEVTCNQQINTITPYDSCNGKFVYYALLAPSFQNEVIKIANSAKATLAIISKGKWEEMSIPVAPLSEQQQIVDRLDSAFAKIDAVKANAEKQLNDAKALFKKELSKAMMPKEGWEEKKVGEIFKTYAGGTPIKTHKEYYEGGDVPWIRSGEVCCKYITECEMFITEEGMNNSSAKYYPENTVLIAMYGATAAQVGILKFEATSNQAVCGILPHKDFVPEYVYYWFSNIQEELAAQAQGGAQPNISQIKIKNVVIPYPPLSEQQAIVTHLDTLSENLKTMEEKQKAVVAECYAMKQALLREVFE